MTRVLGALVYNWPLKLAAIVLATLLYAGFVVSQTATELSDIALSPRVLNQADESYLLTNLPPVTRIRYLADEDAPRPTAGSFEATIDLAGVDPRVGSTFVPISVRSLDPRISVLSFEPPGVLVQLEPLDSKMVPVRVVVATPPPELEVRPPVYDPQTVVVTGPESFVRRVQEVRADVAVGPSPLDVDRDIELVPVDAAGNAVTQVEAEPASVHVQIAVFGNRETRSVPVDPIVTGAPAAGYEVVSIAFDPRVVSVEGDLDELTALLRAETAAVDITNATSDIALDVPLALPEGVLAIDLDTVSVRVVIRPEEGTRTFDAGFVLAGRAAGLDYELGAASVLVTVGGPIVDLERLEGATFTVTLDVAGLAAGQHLVVPAVSLPAGLSLVRLDPASVAVTVTPAAAASDSPAASASPPASASP